MWDVPVTVDVVNVSRARDACKKDRRDAVALNAGALGAPFGVTNADGAKIAEEGAGR